MSMIWDNIVKGNIVYKLRFNSDLSINLEETEVVNKEVNNDTNLISLNDGHSLYVGTDILASITAEDHFLSQTTVSDFMYFYPDKIQLFNKVEDDLKSTKALFDKSIDELSLNCIGLLSKKEELINETNTSTAKFPDNIKIGDTMYANVSGEIVKFIVTSLDSRNIIVISLEGKKLMMLNSNDKVNDKLFLKDDITFHPTLTDAMTFGRVSDINHNFDNLQTRINDLISESSRINVAMKNLRKYGKSKELDINTARK